MFEYLIVGAGPAGCVLADGLSERPDATVLIEAGHPHDFDERAADMIASSQGAHV